MFVVDGKANPELSRTGALAVGIPGSVAAFDKLQKLGDKQEKLANDKQNNSKEKQEGINKDFDNLKEELNQLDKENESLKKPMDLDVDKNGFIYFYNYSKSNILRYDPKTKNTIVILDDNYLLSTEQIFKITLKI